MMKRKVPFQKRKSERLETFLPLSGIEKVKGRAKRRKERKKMLKAMIIRVRNQKTQLPEVSRIE